MAANLMTLTLDEPPPTRIWPPAQGEWTYDEYARLPDDGNPLHDRRTKFHLYAHTGVREYWIVDPDARTLDVYVLRGHAYALLATFGPDDEARSELLPTLTFLTRTLFPA